MVVVAVGDRIHGAGSVRGLGLCSNKSSGFLALPGQAHTARIDVGIYDPAPWMGGVDSRIRVHP